MSLDLYLYSKKSPTRGSIEKIIFPLGFQVADEADGKSYFWFGVQNYESIRGCWLFISKPDTGEEGIPKGTCTVFRSYTNERRSYEDIDMQNNVIRALKLVFGGSVYDGWNGRYAYIENDLPRLSPSEKRCGFIYDRFCNNLILAM